MKTAVRNRVKMRRDVLEMIGFDQDVTKRNSHPTKISQPRWILYSAQLVQYIHLF
jgi:hypothetical protein